MAGDHAEPDAAIAIAGDRPGLPAPHIEARLPDHLGTKKLGLKLKLQPSRTSVNSITISQKPRVSRNRLISLTLRPRVP